MTTALNPIETVFLYSLCSECISLLFAESKLHHQLLYLLMDITALLRWTILKQQFLIWDLNVDEAVLTYVRNNAKAINYIFKDSLHKKMALK